MNGKDQKKNRKKSRRKSFNEGPRDNPPAKPTIQLNCLITGSTDKSYASSRSHGTTGSDSTSQKDG